MPIPPTDQSPLIESLPEMLAVVRTLGAPFELERGGDRIGDPRSGCFWGPSDGEAAAAELMRAFSAEDLVDSGVCFVGEQGELSLAPELQRGAGPLIELKEGDASRPFAVLSGNAILPAHGFAPTAALRDGRTIEMLAEEGDYLWTSPTDAPLLRTLGVPASPWGEPGRNAAWLRDVIQSDFADASRLIAKRREALPRGPKSASSQRKSPGLCEPTLILSGWSPTGWNPGKQAELEALVRFYASLRQAAPGWLPTIGVWLPSDGERQELDLLCQAGCARDLRTELSQSLQRHLYDVRRALQLGVASPAPQRSLAELRGAYQEALVFLDPTIGREEIARRRSAYLEKLAQGSNAEASSDPLDSCIGDELYALRAYSPELRAAIEKDALGPGSNLDKLLEQQRKGANHLIKLLKAKTSLGGRL